MNTNLPIKVISFNIPVQPFIWETNVAYIVHKSALNWLIECFSPFNRKSYTSIQTGMYMYGVGVCELQNHFRKVLHIEIYCFKYNCSILVWRVEVPSPHQIMCLSMDLTLSVKIQQVEINRWDTNTLPSSQISTRIQLQTVLTTTIDN